MEANILLWIQEHMRNDILTPVMSVITSLGDSGWFWIVLALILLGAALIIRYKNKEAENPLLRISVTCLIAMVLTFIIGNLILKNAIARIRPYDRIPDLILLAKKPHDFSFPSGHTSFSFSCATALLFTVPKEKRLPAVLLVILAALIGFSRLYLGVHYPTDVLAGAVLGCLCGKAAEKITGKFM